MFVLLSTDDSDENRYWESHVDRFSGDYSLAFQFTAVAYFDDVGRDFAGGNLVPSTLSNFFPLSSSGITSKHLIRLERLCQGQTLWLKYSSSITLKTNKLEQAWVRLINDDKKYGVV